MNRYTVIKERFHEENVGIILCEVRKLLSPWEKEKKEFLCLYNERAVGSDNFQVFTNPGFVRLSPRNEKNLWKAINNYRVREEEEKERLKVEERYSKIFEEEEPKEFHIMRENPPLLENDNEEYVE